MPRPFNHAKPRTAPNRKETMFITVPMCAEGEVLPLLPPDAPLAAALYARTGMPGPMLPHASLFTVGTELLDQSGEATFQVCGRTTVPGSTHAISGPLLRCLRLVPGGREAYVARRNGFAVAVITLSDKGAAGLREDKSGPLVMDMCRAALPVCFGQNYVLPDEARQLQALVTELAYMQGYDLVLTTGGTGLSPRDTTPESLIPILDRRLPGFEQAMMQAALAKTPHAMLSRAVAGCLGTTLAVSLPGSTRAVEENLTVILPACRHAMEKLHNDLSDCGRVA